MRWNSSGVSFSRPIRWLVSLLGREVVPFSYAGLAAGRQTTGPRFGGSPQIELSSADTYLASMQAQQIIVDRAERRERVAAEVTRIATEVEGTIPTTRDCWTK